MGMYLGIDVGYGYTKVYGGRNLRLKFPSLVIANTGAFLDQVNTVKFNGSEYVVGVGGKDLRSDDFPFTGEYRALLFFAIVQAADRLGVSIHDVYVGIGVPPAFRSKREEIRKKLTRKVDVEINGRKYSFNLKVAVFLQGWGGYIDHIYTLEGKYLKENDVPAIYSDWGFYTVDTIVAKRAYTAYGEKIIPALPENGNPTIKKGVSTLYQLYSRLVADEYGTVIPDIRTAERMFLNGKYPEIVKRAVELWKKDVLEELLARYKEEVFGLEKIVVFGGGANLIEKDLKVENYPVIKLDEFANARGYFKALPSVFKEG